MLNIFSILKDTNLLLLKRISLNFGTSGNTNKPKLMIRNKKPNTKKLVNLKTINKYIHFLLR